jgi:hypothetical protein
MQQHVATIRRSCAPVRGPGNFQGTTLAVNVVQAAAAVAHAARPTSAGRDDDGSLDDGDGMSDGGLGGEQNADGSRKRQRRTPKQQAQNAEAQKRYR